MGREKNYLIIGCDGFVGKALSKFLVKSEIPFYQTTRRLNNFQKGKLYFDLSKEAVNWKCPNEVTVAFICAGISSIKKCEENPSFTRILNVENTIKLSRNLVENGIHVIYLSSDMVFDGLSSFSKIDQPLNPKTEYGKQKAEAEKQLLALGKSITVVRFTKIIDFEMTLLKDWIRTLKKGRTIYPYLDMVLSPVPLKFAIKILCDVAKKGIFGIIQVSGKSDITYADFAYRVADILGIQESQINPIKVSDSNFNLRFKTKYSSLNNDRLIREFRINPPTLQNTIEYLKENISEI